MHRKVYRTFNKLLSPYNITGKVLEIGATLTEDTLLTLPALSRASFKLGVNLLIEGKRGDFEIIKGNANSLPFDDEEFDCVISNATLEHDKYFWKTCDEMKRVLKKGGILAVGFPGFAHNPILRRIPLLKSFTFTYRVHNAPGDYYRFSPQAMREVILEGTEVQAVKVIMQPPRIIGIGIKK